jgi:hypothetical protein
MRPAYPWELWALVVIASAATSVRSFTAWLSTWQRITIGFDGARLSYWFTYGLSAYIATPWGVLSAYQWAIKFHKYEWRQS